MTLLLLLACANDKPVLQGSPLGSCTYESPFSGLEECRAYYATTEDHAEADCSDLGSTFQKDVPCDTTPTLGTCTYDDGDAQIVATVLDDSTDECGSNQFGCEVFANGYWEPSDTCTGETSIEVLDDPFPMPEQVCFDPAEGEPAGHSANGQVCVWNMVSGTTEEGRNFADDVGCDTVMRQRPYSEADPGPHTSDLDERMDDPDYVEDVDWVRGQLLSGSCACCHASGSGRAAAVFDADFDGNPVNQFNDRGLAMAAGWIPTIGFGTYPAEENNGFWRSSPELPYLSIIPSTDPLRMMTFFEAEAERRGLTREDFASDTYGAGPLDAARLVRPEQCSAEEGIARDGTIRWLPGKARYLYVMEAASDTPTVPPNLDLPSGTLWRIDLPEDGTPVDSKTVVYGEVPDTMVQRWPETGAPAPLVDGRQYYLYVSADVLYPITQCLFTAGEADPTEDEAGCSATGGLGGLGALGLTAALAAGRRRR